MEWTKEQLEILDIESHKVQPAYLRLRCLVVWHAAHNKAYAEIAAYFRTTRQSVGKWVNDFHRDGMEGLRIKKGRGRKPRSSHDDVKDYILQSPLNFGLKRTRWNLKLLAETVPSLKGFSLSGVYRTLKRLELGYKRGQPHIHSPDPLYSEKKRSSRQC